MCGRSLMGQQHDLPSEVPATQDRSGGDVVPSEGPSQTSLPSVASAWLVATTSATRGPAWIVRVSIEWSRRPSQRCRCAVSINAWDSSAGEEGHDVSLEAFGRDALVCLIAAGLWLAEYRPHSPLIPGAVPIVFSLASLGCSRQGRRPERMLARACHRSTPARACQG
jgi:hypothetical protein